MPRILITGLLLTVLVSYAASQPRLAALALEEILAAPLDLTVGGASATLLVTTSIDVACVVVFGRADAFDSEQPFGAMAFDVDMGAAAHRDHHVIMRGLEPDTEYVYRLQGSDVHGRFYASDVLRFRTPTQAAAGPAINVATLAKGAQVGAVSSEFGSAYAAVHALDGDPRTEWSSRGDGDEAFLTVLLPKSVRLAGFGVWTRTMGSSAQIARFEVVNELGEVFGPYDVPDASGLHVFDADGEGREFTFRVIASTGGNTGMVEVAVFEAAAP